MGEYSRVFIKASVIYLLVGAVFGLWMAFDPAQLGRMIPVHVHFMLLGWVSMLMFAVAYHILPRFHAKLLYSERMAFTHFYIANLSLIGMAYGFWAGSTQLVAVFGSLQTIGFLLFAYNIYKSVEPFVMPIPPGMPGTPGTPGRPPSAPVQPGTGAVSNK